MRISEARIINNFIDMNKRQYVIPVYQRNYEWATDQCRKLFEDIVAAHEHERPHFCGSVVYALLENIGHISRYVLIDGQQRFTTIYILLKALMDMAETEHEREVIREVMINKDKFDTYTTDEATKLKLKPIKSDNSQLLLLMEDKKSQMSPESGILRNYTLFCELIRDYFVTHPDAGVRNIFDGVERLTCAEIQLDEKEDNAQEIFERINSTGVPLSLADKIRNYVLMGDANQDRLYEEYWLPMERELGLTQINDFFLDYLNMKSSGNVQMRDAYDEFKAIHVCGEDGLKELTRYARQYNIFLKGSDELSTGANQALAGILYLKQTTVFLFLFHVFDDFEKKVIDMACLEKVLKLLLAYSIRRMICEIPSGSARGFYKTLYNRVYSVEANKECYYDSLVSFLKQVSSVDVLPGEEAFRQALQNNDLYHKNALCRYLLLKIENRGKEQVSAEGLSIEHIMPQNRNLSSEWQRMLGENWILTQETYLHTLGNLALTGYNSEMGDKPFAEKKKKLEDSSTKMTELYKDVLNKESWNRETIEARANRLADIIMEQFPVEPPLQEVVFTDPYYHEYTLADPNEATYKHVNYYVLRGQRVNVDSFALMVRSVASDLFDDDSRPIEKMASTLATFPSWKIPVFSYDPSKVRNPVKFNRHSDIYIASGFSAQDCAYFLRALLSLYDLSVEDDFVYSARREKKDDDTQRRTEIIKVWCEEKAKSGVISFNREYSQRRYIRVSTPLLDSLVPSHPDRLCQWKSPRYIFYEFSNYQGEMYVDLYFYTKDLTEAMKKALRLLADTLKVTVIPHGYTRLYASSRIPHTECKTPEEIAVGMEKLLKEIMNFEAGLRRKLEENAIKQ